MNNTDEGMKTMTTPPPRRQYLSMADRVPNGEPINDAIAAMQATQRASSRGVSLIKDPIKINEAARAGVCHQALLALQSTTIELNFINTPEDHDRDCEGHEVLNAFYHGMTDYCDGSCRPAWTPLIRR